MRWKRTVTVVAHAEGEANDVIVGGVLPPPPGATMFERMRHLETRADELRQMLLFDPHGVARCVNLVTPPCDPRG